MASGALRWPIVAAFSVALGHLAWNTLIGPPLVAESFVGGHVLALTGPDPEAKNLYVRRLLYLPQRPRHAWLQVLGRDRHRVYVNGTFLAERVRDGFPVASVLDLTPYLRVGPNVIAIAAAQASLRHPPVVAVEGAYAFGERDHHPLRSDDSWRCGAVFERGAGWWFSPEFDDRHWAPARVVLCDLRARVDAPPRATTAVGKGRWVTPAELDRESAGVRREFVVAGRPRQGWVRVTATSSYRLAVNGILVDVQEEQLATTRPIPPVRRSYEVTPTLRRGRNVVSLILTRTANPPHLLVDAEVEDDADSRLSFGTDEQWVSRPGLHPDWLATSSDDTSAWRPCLVASGDLAAPPWQITRQEVAFALPWPVTARRVAAQVGLMALFAILTSLIVGVASYLAPPGRDGSNQPAPIRAAELALIPPTLAIAAAVLATYDPRVARQDVYSGVWVYLAIASVPCQWLLLMLGSGDGEAADRPASRRWRTATAAVGVSALVIGLAATGFWLRIRDLPTEPLQWDEVENVQATRGFLERGFPSRMIHPDLPIAYVHTSELMFIPTALAALAFDDDRYIVRFPAACFSTLTIVLIYVAGRRLFGTPVGLLAAALAALSPMCIAMSDFGRYFAQLQFLTLLTVYTFWLTVGGPGPIDRRALWLTAASFLGMYLTWEGSALIAPGMMLAALERRRGRLGTILLVPAVWAALLVVAMVIVLQLSFATLERTKFLWYGTSLSDLTLKPVWRYPFFRPWYYVWESSWSQDALLPMVGLLGVVLLAIRHGFRRPARFLALIHLTTCVSMAALLPSLAWRYIHHMVPLTILLASAVVVAVTRHLVRPIRRPGMPPLWRRYAGVIGLLMKISALALGCGMTAELDELASFRVEGYGTRTFKFPNLEGPAKYLRQNVREGDMILATDPFQVNHLVGHLGQRRAPTDYWPESVIELSATLDDQRPVPRDRRDGTPLLPDLESLADLFARHDRIWYVVQPERHGNRNVAEVSAFLRQHMEVVYEDFEAIVLFRGPNHRPTRVRLRDDRMLRDAKAGYLP